MNFRENLNIIAQLVIYSKMLFIGLPPYKSKGVYFQSHGGWITSIYGASYVNMLSVIDTYNTGSDFQGVLTTNIKQGVINSVDPGKTIALHLTTHWGRDKIADIKQTTLSSAFFKWKC